MRLAEAVTTRVPLVRPGTAEAGWLVRPAGAGWADGKQASRLWIQGKTADGLAVRRAPSLSPFPGCSPSPRSTGPSLVRLPLPRDCAHSLGSGSHLRAEDCRIPVSGSALPLSCETKLPELARTSPVQNVTPSLSPELFWQEDHYSSNHARVKPQDSL